VEHHAQIALLVHRPAAEGVTPASSRLAHCPACTRLWYRGGISCQRRGSGAPVCGCMAAGPPGLSFPAFFASSCKYHHRQLQHAGLQDAAVVDSFLCALRNLYDSRGTHCLHAVMLAGVDSLHWVLDEHNAR